MEQVNIAIGQSMPAEYQAFREQVMRQKQSHAYVVEGARGSGKRKFALWCAQALLCTSQNGATVPCGVCPSCRKATSGYHPDLHLYGDGDKAVSVGDVRSLIHETGLVPSEGDRSVYILFHAEKMLAAAQNALLKIFEEPPAGVTVFLLTESRRALLPTIRSRGQLITMSRMQTDRLEMLLESRFPQKTKEEIALAVRNANGSMGEAEAFFEKGALQNREKAKEWLDAAFTGDKYRLFSLLTGAKYKRETVLPLVDTFLQMLFDLLLRKIGASPSLLTDAEADARCAFLTRNALAYLCEQTLLCRELLESNGNVTAGMTRLASEIWSVTGGNAVRLT